MAPDRPAPAAARPEPAPPAADPAAPRPEPPDPVEGRTPERAVALDGDGFLLDWRAWDEGLAVALAAQDDLTLTPAHWEILRFLRRYYTDYGLTPVLRILARAIARRLGPDKGTRAYLYGLFPLGPVRQGARYAGLPKPPSCI
jgi:tRNA 2-thiouridine synthesizing protein E